MHRDLSGDTLGVLPVPAWLAGPSRPIVTAALSRMSRFYGVRVAGEDHRDSCGTAVDHYRWQQIAGGTQRWAQAAGATNRDESNRRRA
jgi:hypothetical protein